MLAALAPASLARMCFPLAELTKPQVRALAAEAGLPVASRAESQDLCFLAGTGKARFLARHGGLEDAPGEIVRRSGEVVGRATAARTTSRSASARGSASPRAEPLYVLAHRRGVAGRRRHARRAGRRSRARARRAAAPAGRRGRRACGCATTRARCRAGSWGRGRGWSWSCASRSTAPRPGRWPACCGATWWWAGGPSPLERRRTAAVRGWVGSRGDSITRVGGGRNCRQATSRTTPFVRSAVVIVCARITLTDGRPRSTRTPSMLPFAGVLSASRDATPRPTRRRGSRSTRSSARPRRPRTAPPSARPRCPRAPAARVRVPSPATRRRTGR